MNVIMLVDSNNAYHQRQTRHRTLPKAPKDSSRSKSLSRKEEGSKSLSRKEEASKSLSRKEEGKHSSTSGVMRHPNQLSSSSHQLSGKREEAVEVPVIVDEVTKWISGVNKNTTCRDVISVILRRQNIQGYKVGNRSQHQIGHRVISSNQLDPAIQLAFYVSGVRCPQIHCVRALEEGGQTAETLRSSSGHLDSMGPRQTGCQVGGKRSN